MVHDASMVREHVDHFNRIDGDIRKLREDVATLAVHVEQNTNILHGNGQPGLIEEVTKFHAAYFAHEEARERERKERSRNHWTLAGILVTAFVTILIAFLGWAWANVGKPILDDIYRNHPAAKVVEKSSVESPIQAYTMPKQDAQLPNLR